MRGCIFKGLLLTDIKSQVGTGRGGGVKGANVIEMHSTCYLRPYIPPGSIFR